MSEANTILEVKNLRKIFPPKVEALDDITLSLKEGRMYALVGENGAGKSTLLKIIFGLYGSTSGKVFFKGEEITRKSPQENIDKGIAMITQELSLIPTFDAFENTGIQREFSNHVFLNLSECGQKLSENASELEFKIEFEKKTSDIPLEDCQKLEILRRLSTKVELLMLDEPSTMLTPLEEEQVLYALKKLVDKLNLTVIITTHKFQNLLKYPDEIIVMRKGNIVLQDTVKRLSITDVIRAVTGEEPRKRVVASPHDHERRKGLLEVENLSSVNDEGVLSLKNINLRLHRGEIVGVVGSAFSGKDMLAKAILSMVKNIEGTVTFDGEDITNKNTRYILRKGMDCILKDREVMLIPTLPVADNIVLNRYYHEPFSKNFIRNEAAITELAEEAIKAFNIKTPSTSTLVKSLSGGNQRKVVLARALLKEAKLVIAEDPTIGLDIQTSQEVMNYLVELRNKGGGVLLISEELGDVISYSDTIYVLYEKEVKKVLPSSEATIEKLGGFMLGLDKV
jgi:simple sugar transport system ATP-binding protein